MGPLGGGSRGLFVYQFASPHVSSGWMLRCIGPYGFRSHWAFSLLVSPWNSAGCCGDFQRASGICLLWRITSLFLYLLLWLVSCWSRNNFEFLSLHVLSFWGFSGLLVSWVFPLDSSQDDCFAFLTVSLLSSWMRRQFLSFFLYWFETTGFFSWSQGLWCLLFRWEVPCQNEISFLMRKLICWPGILAQV